MLFTPHKKNTPIACKAEGCVAQGPFRGRAGEKGLAGSCDGSGRDGAPRGNGPGS